MTPPILEASPVLHGLRTRTLAVDGDGPSILLLPGFTDSADSWRPLLAELGTRGRRAVAVDLPGAGEAGTFSGGIRLANLDAFTTAFVEAYAGDEPAILAGNSLGGLLAMRAATRDDHRLSAIAPIGTAGLAYTPRWLLFERSVRAAYPLLQVAYRAPVPAPLVREGAAWLYERRLSEGRADRALARYYASHLDGMRSVRRFTAMMLAVADDVRADPLVPADIRVPVLLIWGDHDRLADVSGAQAVLDVVPDSRLVVLDGCGHCPQMQRPADIAELLNTLAREEVSA
jgi:pimeloyl-ACP methyl ester carboxylesterase